jgi:hypothetical protein
MWASKQPCPGVIPEQIGIPHTGCSTSMLLCRDTSRILNTEAPRRGMAVIQHDLLGLGGTNIAAMVQRDADRLAAFDRWLGTMTSQVMSGIWLEAAVTRAWIAGRKNATSAVGAAVYAPSQRVLPRALELNWQASRARWPMSYYGSLKVPWSPT